MPGTERLRRAVLPLLVALGGALFAFSVGDMARMDGELRAAAAPAPELTRLVADRAAAAPDGTWCDRPGERRSWRAPEV